MPFMGKLDKYYSKVMKRKDSNCVGIWSGEAETASNLSEYTKKCIQRQLEIVGNYMITWASSLYHICKENGINLAYSFCHKKR